MSIIAEYHGRVQYCDDDVFENVVTELVEHGWISDNNHWLIKPEVEADVGANADENTITIPRSSYRNFYTATRCLLSDAICGTIVGTTTDGSFSGRVLTPEGRWCTDLRDWAQLRGYGSIPSQDETSYPYWCSSVIDDFHASHSYRTTLQDFSCDSSGRIPTGPDV